ncbi:MAG: alpha/beta hydrolase, partial [Granulosicoccus sp.]
GHSMASDLVVRYAQTNDSVMATVGVAMFSPAVTSTSPRNLLMINGEWEPRLNSAAMDVLRQASVDDEVNAGITYGRFDDGTARRFVVAENTEHVAVLFSVNSASATINWLDQVFGIDRTDDYQPQPRGRWILLLIAGIVTLWRVLAPLLPTVSLKENTSRLTVIPTMLVIALPMVLTPFLLSLFTISFLPVLVGDYLAVHLALYGLLSAALTVRLRRGTRSLPTINNEGAANDIVLWNLIDWYKFSIAVLLLLLFSLPLAAVLNWQLASFWPTVERLPLLLAVGAGTLCWFLADEWATRGNSQWQWAYPVSKVAFLLSLGIAVALNFDGLFFLLLIVPIMIPMLVVFGLLSRWSYRSTGCAQVAAVSNALVLAWAIAVTFPWVAVSTS